MMRENHRVIPICPEYSFNTCLRLQAQDQHSSMKSFLSAADVQLQAMPALSCETAKDRLERLKAYKSCWDSLSAHLEVPVPT